MFKSRSRRQPVAFVLQFLLQVFALSEVARDLGEAEQSSVFIADGGNDGAAPELRSVPANPPAFILEAAACGRGLQFLLRLAGGNLGGSKEH